MMKPLRAAILAVAAVLLPGCITTWTTVYYVPVYSTPGCYVNTMQGPMLVQCPPIVMPVVSGYFVYRGARYYRHYR